MTGLIHNENFEDFAHAVIAVECWAREAERDGRPLGDLFAVVDSRDNDAVETTLASRAYCRQTFALHGDDGREWLRALDGAGKQRDVLQVLAIASGKVDVTPLEPIARWARQTLRNEGMEVADAR